MNEQLVARPRATLATAIVLSVILVAAALVGWFAMPADTRARFTVLQWGTLVFFAGVMVTVMMSMGLSMVTADATGIRFRNGWRTRHIEWADVRAIRFRDGDPWAYVLLARPRTDGRERYQLMGIQHTDRGLAERHVARLREMLAHHEN